MLNTLFDALSPLAYPQWAGTPFAFSLSSHPRETGTFLADRYDSDTGSLRYKLFVPDSYDGAPMPLIVMLHGGGQDADDFALGTGMNALAEEAGCLVAYPEQSASANWSRCWNWFDEARLPAGRGESARIAGMTHKIMTDYAVDATRVYAAGLSSGGAMAVILGRNYPDLFAAIGSHSGLAYGSASDQFSAMVAMRNGVDPDGLADAESGRGVPTIAFHGDRDATVHPLNSHGVVRQFIDAYGRHLGQRHGTIVTSEETSEAAGRDFTRVVHASPAGHILAEQWTVHGTGHAWSGGNWRGSYTDPAGPNASREMLRFFLLHQNRLAPRTPASVPAEAHA